MVIKNKYNNTMSTTILATIIVLCLVFIAGSLISIANTLWDILQEFKKK